ncbi:Amino acid adenylation domain-containing protein [Sulfidibacter corallicola]|uniref:Amino acid adenylation domain-containing protein n=1 Tax=Sulfidibacter corallicola TaxID=2818388 RepID=A0A8A4TR01_SULCO|nr:non-ribosomal peptide synthetase [Sulfidibacter corallicola]QTD48945.1 amino acid adenylation domain-containing protein [Sulfidibacter corallicola]
MSTNRSSSPSRTDTGAAAQPTAPPAEDTATWSAHPFPAFADTSGDPVEHHDLTIPMTASFFTAMDAGSPALPFSAVLSRVLQRFGNGGMVPLQWFDDDGLRRLEPPVTRSVESLVEHLKAAFAETPVTDKSDHGAQPDSTPAVAISWRSTSDGKDQVDPLAEPGEACPIRVVVTPSASSLEIRISTWAASLGAGYAERLARHVAHAATVPPEQWQDPTALLPESERHMLLKTFNPRSGMGIDPQPLHEQFEARVGQHGDDMAVLSEDLCWSYALLNAQADQLATLLRGELDVREGDLIAVIPDRRAYLPLTLLAILKSGGAYLPIDPDFPEQRTRFILEDAKPKVVICFGHPPAIIHECDARLVQLDRLVWQADTSPCRHHGKPEDLAYVIYTSGSTGNPKGVEVEHRHFHSMIHAQIHGFEVKRGDRVLQMASPSFDASLSEIFMALLSGAALVLASPEAVANQKKLAALIERFEVTHATFPPAYLHSLSDEAIEPLRVIITAGEAPIREDARRIAKHKIYINAYGPTETAVCASFYRVDPKTDSEGRIPIGRPLPDLGIYIVSPDLELLPLGMEGEICIAGKGVARGYLNRAELTDATFVQNPFCPGERLYRTGDMGFWNLRGELVFLGRADDQVKINGYRVELGEIQYHLNRHVGIEEAVVLATTREFGRRELSAYFTRLDTNRFADQNEAQDPLAPTSLRACLARCLPRHMIPAHFIELDRFPRNTSGKVDKKALPEVTRRGTTPYRAPRTEVERHLVSLWEKVLAVTHVGIHDNFFELGGDSLAVIRLVSILPEDLLHLSFQDLFQSPTIAELAVLSKGNAPSTTQEVNETAPSAEPLPLLASQGFFFTNGGTDQCSVRLRLEAPDPIQVNALRMAMEQVQQHQPNLTQVFVQTPEGSWVRHFNAANPDLQLVEEATLHDLIEGAEVTFDLATGPLWRVILAPEWHPNQLLLIAHRALANETDLLVLHRNLETAYRASLVGEVASFPHKPVTPGELLAYAENHQALASAVPARSRDGAGLGLAADRTQYQVTLSPAKTRALLVRAGKTYRCKPFDIMLAAMLHTHVLLTNEECLQLTAGDQDRQPPRGPDLSHTVASLERHFVVTLTAPNRRNRISDWIRTVKETLRRLPHNGFGSSRLLAMVNDDSFPQFYYLGQLDAEPPDQHLLGSLATPPRTISGPQARAPRAPRYLLSVIKNQLIIDADLPTNMPRNGIRHYLQRYRVVLEDMIEHCCTQKSTYPSPSDFGLSQFDIEAFDMALASHGLNPSEVADMVPLAPLQLSILRHLEENPHDGAFLRQSIYTLAGPLELDIAERAWHYLAHRHPLPRTLFISKGLDRPFQIVQRKRRLPFRTVDLEGMSGADARFRRDELIREEHIKPLDPSTTPLLRVLIIRHHADLHEMVVTCHHLVMEGDSLQQLIDEWFSSYRAKRAGETPALSHRPPFRDYTRWLQSRDPEPARRYWADYQKSVRPFRLIPSMPEFTPSYHPGYMSHVIPERDLKRLCDLAVSVQVTLNSLFKALWSLVLARQGQTRTPVFGVNVSGRPAALSGCAEMLGLFQFAVPLWVRLDPQDRFLDIMRRVQHDAAIAEGTTPLTLDEIRSVAPKRRILFDHLLLLERRPAREPRLEGTRLEILELASYEHTPFPLTVFVTSGPTMELRFAYDRNRLPESLIRSLKETCIAVVDRILAAPETQLGELALVPEDPKREAALQASGTKP